MGKNKTSPDYLGSLGSETTSMNNTIYRRTTDWAKASKVAVAVAVACVFASVNAALVFLVSFSR